MSNIIDIWKLIGISAALLTMFGFFPQIAKIYRTKSAGDISIFTLLQFAIGVALWTLYGIHLKDAVIIVANSVTLLSLLIALGLYVKYK